MVAKLKHPSSDRCCSKLQWRKKSSCQSCCWSYCEELQRGFVPQFLLNLWRLVAIFAKTTRHYLLLAVSWAWIGVFAKDLKLVTSTATTTTQPFLVTTKFTVAPLIMAKNLNCPQSKSLSFFTSPISVSFRCDALVAEHSGRSSYQRDPPILANSPRIIRPCHIATR